MVIQPGNDGLFAESFRVEVDLHHRCATGRSRVGADELRARCELRVRISRSWVTPPYLAWCPDSTCLVVTDSPGEGKPDALFVVSLETGEKRQLTIRSPLCSATPTRRFLPTAVALVFRRTAALFVGELYWLPLGTGLTAGGEPRRLTPAALDAELPDVDARRQRDSLFRQGKSLEAGRPRSESTPARLPFVGEDGSMPVVSRPQPGRPPRLVYVRSFADLNIWRVETSAPGAPASSPPVVAISSTRRGRQPPVFSRRPPGRLCIGSLGRMGNLAGRSATGPTPSSSPPWVLQSQACPAGLPTAN